MAEKETKTELKKPAKKATKKPEVKQNWSSNENKHQKMFMVEILVDNGTMEEVSKTEYPNDAFIVKYHVDDKVCLDLTRGSRTALFDMYYDKFKKELKEINWGKGTISPKVWIQKSSIKKEEVNLNTVVPKFK